MDPVTLLAMANAAVSAVKKGCQLYKDIKSAAGDVSGVLKDIDEQFAGKKVSKEQAKKIEEKRAEAKAIAQADPNDVLAQLGEHLGGFFDAFDKVEQLFYEEERKAKTVYTGSESIGRRALQRVMVRTRLQQMEADLRTEMTWNTPRELGDLWTRFEAMREQIKVEQEQARAEQARKDADAAWRRQQIRNAIEDNLVWLFVLLVVALETAGLLWTIRLHHQNALPSLLAWLS